MKYFCMYILLRGTNTFNENKNFMIFVLKSLSFKFFIMLPLHKH